MEPRDLSLVARQLGRLRYRPEAVAARCYLGYPAAVRANACTRGGGTLSTTLHWITCPWLRARVSTLESQGWIEHLRWVLGHPASGELRARVEADAEGYTRAVAEALDGRVPGLFAGRHGRRIMGVGGTSRPLGLKCLHNHVAWNLAGGGSPIGAFASALLELDLAAAGRRPLDCGRDCAAEPVSPEPAVSREV